MGADLFIVHARNYNTTDGKRIRIGDKLFEFKTGYSVTNDSA